MAPRPSSPNWHWKWLLLLGLLAVFNLFQVNTLLRHVEEGTDFTVFYNTARLLANGASGELYTQTDITTTWLRTIPPFGQMVFQPFAVFSLKPSAIVWSLFNLGLMGASLATLAYFGRRLETHREIFLAALPAMSAVWLVLAQGNIQVGQFSILFASCWIFFLGLQASKYRKFAGVALAIPAGIKLYPVFLTGVFFLQRRFVAFAVALVLCASTLVVPFAMYGNRTWPLTSSFWTNSIADNSSRVTESQIANDDSNQGLDSIMLRYLVDGEKLHKRMPSFPNLHLDRELIIQVTQGLRLAILLISVAVGWLAWPKLSKTPLWGTFLLMALGCACLYLLIPGTKSRYAIYTFLAFIPFILQAVVAQKEERRADFWKWSVSVIVLLMLCIQLVPSAFRTFGICFLGHVALWVVNVKLMWRVARGRVVFSMGKNRVEV